MGRKITQEKEKTERKNKMKVLSKDTNKQTEKKDKEKT